VDITENPPPIGLLRAARAARDGKLGKRFNPSGEQYQALKIKADIPHFDSED